MSKATVEKLGDVHGKIADWCLAKLDEEVPIMTMTEIGPIPTGKTAKAAKASDIAAMTKFLADNKITADIHTNAGLQALDEKLRKQKRHSDNVLTMPSVAASEAKERRYGGEQ